MAERVAVGTSATHLEDDQARVLRLPGILLGAGLRGFVDGIVLHRILQSHHMLAIGG